MKYDKGMNIYILEDKYEIMYFRFVGIPVTELKNGMNFVDGGLLEKDVPYGCGENMKEAINSLTEREQKVIEHRWLEKKSLEEIGNLYDVTKERIRQVESKAKRKLADQHLEKNRMSVCVIIDTDIKDQKISTDSLSGRARNVLRKREINNVQDMILFASDERQLSKMRGVGKTIQNEIKGLANNYIELYNLHYVLDFKHELEELAKKYKIANITVEIDSGGRI